MADNSDALKKLLEQLQQVEGELKRVENILGNKASGHFDHKDGDDCDNCGKKHMSPVDLAKIKDPDEIERELRKMGAPDKVIRIARDIVRVVHGDGGDEEPVDRAIAILISRLEGVMTVFQKMELFLELPKECKDSEGTSLKVGDRLTGGTLTNDGFKEVLEVHFGYVLLSQVGEATKKDDYWFESELKRRGFHIDRDHAIKGNKKKR